MDHVAAVVVAPVLKNGTAVIFLGLAPQMAMPTGQAVVAAEAEKVLLSRITITGMNREVNNNLQQSTTQLLKPTEKTMSAAAVAVLRKRKRSNSQGKRLRSLQRRIE